jgi:hypothetical protein
MMMQAIMQTIMLVQTMMDAMMQVTMLMQAMMQVTGDGGVCDITSPFSNESHKEWPWACLDTTCESFSFFP